MKVKKGTFDHVQLKNDEYISFVRDSSKLYYYLKLNGYNPIHSEPEETGEMLHFYVIDYNFTEMALIVETIKD